MNQSSLRPGSESLPRQLVRFNPAHCDDEVGRFESQTAADVDGAVQRARAAQQSWAQLPPSQRGEALYRVAALLRKRAPELVELVVREVGKTRTEAAEEVDRGIRILSYFAGLGSTPVGDVLPAIEPDATILTERCPLGVVAAITPWNFPVAIPLWKCAPALVYGNAVLFKPSELATATGLFLVDVFHRAGLDPPLLAPVVGVPLVVGDALATHPGIAAVSFTGSPAIGRRLERMVAARGARSQLELGGQNPTIVMPDVDLAAAADTVVKAAYAFAGQKCTATSRIIVHRAVADDFTDLVTRRMSQLRVGDPALSSTDCGPLVSEDLLLSVEAIVAAGLERGAHVVSGGYRLTGGDFDDGWYYAPTLLAGVAATHPLAQEEIFGPIALLLGFESLDEAIEIANRVPYGLSASILTASLGDAMEYARRAEAGVVKINGETAGLAVHVPFGGVKASGSLPAEQGLSARDFYTNVRTVYVRARLHPTGFGPAR